MPDQVFLATLVQSVVLVVASLVGGRLSDRAGRRKVFVAVAALTYGAALFVIAILAVSGDSYPVLYAVAGTCALLAAAAVIPIRRCSEGSPPRSPRVVIRAHHVAP